MSAPEVGMGLGVGLDSGPVVEEPPPQEAMSAKQRMLIDENETDFVILLPVIDIIDFVGLSRLVLSFALYRYGRHVIELAPNVQFLAFLSGADETFEGRTFIRMY